MAVKLRLKRMGAKQRPFYRIVAADSRSKRDGKIIELLGTYSPLEDNKVTLNEEITMKWLNNGAKPTNTVRNIFSKAGIMQKFAETKMKSTKKETKSNKQNSTSKTEDVKKKTTTKKTTTKAKVR